MTIEVREVGAEEGSALFAGAAALAGCARSLAEWRWFLTNPAGTRALVLLEDGRALGHYACVARRTWIAAHAALFSEVVDAFALRPGHAGLQRESRFQRLAREAEERYGASGVDLVHYGLGGAEWRVANARCGHEIVRDQSMLVRTLAPPAVPRPAPASIERLERFDHQAKWLWDRCAGQFGAAAIRDEAYLNWRYVGRPLARYELLGVRDAQGILRGACVLRAGQFAAQRALWLVDWIVPPAEPEVGAELLAGAEATARALGHGALATWFPEWSPWFESFQRAGFRVQSSGAFAFCRSFARKFDELWLRDSWWTTPGDLLVL